MAKQVLFLQGVGAGAYDEDAKLAESLRSALGAEYDVVYPALPHEADPDYQTWKPWFAKELAAIAGPVVVVGHSNGGSLFLKYLSETKDTQPLASVFILGAPYWGGDGWRYDGYEKVTLPEDFAATVPQELPLFFYHCRDDEIAPYKHLALYGTLLPHAVFQSMDAGGHQFNNDLRAVAHDIKTAQNKAA